ncbi:MAG: LD-carboxypeptidase, partial [Micavibrio aeruginosavorus]
MMIIQPPFLISGDTIGVMAPSSRIARADIDCAKSFLEERGYGVFIHPQTYLHADDDPATQYAGTVQEKVSALHDLAANSDIKAVFFASGGQRAMHMLDHIDYTLIAQNPKIYMGFSDNTSLVNAISAKSGLVTYHGPTFKRLLKNPQADFNLRLLSGLEKSIPLEGATTLKNGTAEGTLFGGNLA